MKRLLAVFVLLSLCVLPTPASADPIIHVYSALAPNVYGSPSWATWETNAVTAMQNGGAPTGTSGSPTYFETRSNVTSAEAIVTGFRSWLGQTDPGTVFGPGFANELGNRMHFPLWIDGNGTSFSISQLGFSGSSTDPSNALAFAYGPSGYNYGTGYVGLNYGADNTKGGGDDFFVTSGANTQLVNELFGRGSGNSFAAYCAGCSLADQQIQLDLAAAYPGSDFTFTGTYYLVDGAGATIADGSATFNITAVPEPASLFLFGAGLLGTAVATRRRRTVEC